MKGLIGCIVWGALAVFCWPDVGLPSTLASITMGDILRFIGAACLAFMAVMSIIEACQE